MVANGQVTLSWQPTGGTAYITAENATNDDKVEFSDGVSDTVLQPTGGRIALIRSEWSITRKDANNALTGGDEVSTPDTGPGGISVTYHFVATGAGVDSPLARLRNWAAQDNGPNSKTRRGRISVQSKTGAAFSVQASANVGFKIRKLTTTEEHNDGKITGTLMLVLDGTLPRLGA